MGIYIENLHLHLYLDERPTVESLEAELAEQLGRAEKALYETASDEAKATAGDDDYWDKLFAEVTEVVDETPPQATTVFAVGDRVRHTGNGTPDGFSGKHAGYKGVSLKGKTGTIVHLDGGHKDALVRWDDWFDGHAGFDHDGSTNHWFAFLDTLEKL